MFEHTTALALVAAGTLVIAVALRVLRRRRSHPPWLELVERPGPEAGRRTRLRDQLE